MSKDKTIDQTMIDRFRTQAAELMAEFSVRDENNVLFDEAFHLNWGDASNPLVKNKRITISSDARDKVLGATRLMVATDPAFKVFTPTDDDDEQDDDHLAAVISRQWMQSSRLLGEPLQYPLVTSGLLYGEMHAAITPMVEIVERARKQAEKGDKYAAKRIKLLEQQAKHTAFRIDPLNPTGGYYQKSNGLLECYYRRTETTYGAIVGEYGQCAGMERTPLNQAVTLNVWWDLAYCAAWLDQGGPLYLEENDYPFVPVMVQIVDGSSLFTTPETQVQPMLYGMIKSGMYKNENLALTTIFSQVFSKLVKEKLLHTMPQGQPEKYFVPDYDTEVWDVEAGETIQPMNIPAIDGGLMTAYQLASEKSEQSTIPAVALGAPVGRNTTFSETNLLSQAGRLPLIGSQKRGGWGIGAIAEMMIGMWRYDGAYKTGKVRKTEFPEGTRVEATLDVKLPQDKLQLANIARILTTGENPVTSVRWARENILNIGDSDGMDSQIRDEKADSMFTQIEFGKLMEAEKQRQAMAQQAQMAQQGPPQGMPPGQPGQMPPQGMPPEMQGGPMMGAEQTDMVQGGLPPQQAGMMPGAGMGMGMEGME